MMIEEHSTGSRARLLLASGLVIATVVLSVAWMDARSTSKLSLAASVPGLQLMNTLARTPGIKSQLSQGSAPGLRTRMGWMQGFTGPEAGRKQASGAVRATQIKGPIEGISTQPNEHRSNGQTTDTRVKSLASSDLVAGLSVAFALVLMGFTFAWRKTSGRPLHNNEQNPILAMATVSVDAEFGDKASGLSIPGNRSGSSGTYSITSHSIPGESCTGEKIAVAGATGYIGKAVVRESVRRGYPTTAIMRDLSKGKSEQKFEGAELKEFDVQDREGCLNGQLFSKGAVDVVICCLASRSGTKKDSYAVDYQASLNCAEAAKAAGARRFILLSAYCVKSAERDDPYALQFQYAKMELEKKLLEISDDTFDYVSVRPTAFFKSVSGQVEVVNAGGPFVYFDLGNGRNATCNPISEPDLAAALIDQVAENTHKNTFWNLGGPDEGLSMKAQGEMIHNVLEKKGEAKTLAVPIGLFDFIINGLQWIADTFKSEKFEDAAELGRIGKYYAVEDMLTTDPSEKYGRTTLRKHYEYIAENGQEYDPYTTVFGSAGSKKELQKGKQTEEMV